MRKLVIAIAVVVVLIGIAIPIVIQGQSPNPSRSPGSSRAAVNRATVDRGDFKITVSATGSIAANHTAQLAFDQAGRVQDVKVQLGQHVEAGQVLAVQDDALAKANLTQAQHNADAAQATLQKLLEPVDPGEIAKAEANVKAAEAAYSSAANSVSMAQIHTAELQYQKALAVQQSAKAQLDTDALKYQKDDPNYQTYLAQYGQATFNAEVARLQMEQAKRGRSLASSTAQIAYQQALLAQLKAGPKQSDIDTAQANYALAKLQLEQAQHELDKTRLVAPFAGDVLTINIKPGEVSSGAAIVLTNTNDVYASINVDETDIGQIEVGQPVTITLDALSGVTLTGKVQQISKTADTTASVITYAVKTQLDPTQAPVKVGMTTNAVFLVQDVKNVLRVPSQYVRLNRDTGQNTVTLLNPDGTTTEVVVKLGAQGQDYSEVIEGLNEGETVVLANATSSANGARSGQGAPPLP